MYLSQFVPDKARVVAAVMAMPKAAQMPYEAKVQEAYKMLGAIVKEIATYELHITLSDAVAEYEAVNGNYPNDALGDEGQRRRDEYESGLDDAVEKVMEPYTAFLSQSWLGANTIDSRIWEPDGPRRVAESAAKEIWKSANASRTPAQVLASAGITAADFAEDAVVIHQPVQQTEGTFDMAEAINAVLLKIKTRIGTEYDRLAVYEDLQTIFEEDDGELVNSATSRLGIDMADAEVLRIAALEFEDAPSDISDMLEKTNAGPTPPKPRAPRTPKAPATTAPVAGQLDGGVLEALKTCGAGESAMAEALGVSRSTFVNYSKNKSPFVPDADARAMLRKEVVTRANMMLAALATIDGAAEPFVVQ